MKEIKSLILGAAILTAALLTPPAKAADYAVQKTFWEFNGTWTNVVGAVTNLNAAIDLTQFPDFVLQCVLKNTNAASAGLYSLQWEWSADGSNWPTYTNNAAAPSVTGFFSFPTTNDVTTVWNTNITANSYGYWRIRHATNASSCNFTNISIKGYVKPKRTARDQ